jgi:hypothetical protein
MGRRPAADDGTAGARDQLDGRGLIMRERAQTTKRHCPLRVQHRLVGTLSRQHQRFQIAR